MLKVGVSWNCGTRLYHSWVQLTLLSAPIALPLEFVQVHFMKETVVLTLKAPITTEADDIH